MTSVTGICHGVKLIEAFRILRDAQVGEGEQCSNICQSSTHRARSEEAFFIAMLLPVSIDVI